MHKTPKNFSDRVALGVTKMLRFLADTFFAKRYGNRAVVLETVAAVPGMVAGMLIHLKSLRKMRDDNGLIHEMLAEAENERMHLMTFVEIAQPNIWERLLVLVVQMVFFVIYFLCYLFVPKACHRMIGYFEEEAVRSYTQYLEEIDSGEIENVPAPKIAIEYWNLPSDARLREVVVAVRADEENHRDVNHDLSDNYHSRKI